MNARKALTIMIVCLFAGLGAVSASAQQITLGASSQNVVVTSDGGGIVDVQLGSCVAGTCTLSGSAIGADGEAGTYSLVTTVGTDHPDFGPQAGSTGVFPLVSTDGTTTVLNFTDTTDGDSNLSNIPLTYVDIANGSSNPHFDFTTPLSKAQDEFILGPTITCSAGVSPCNLENVSDAAAGATLSGPVSSGEVSVPEPASMALLGTALLGAALLLGRMIRIPEGTGTYQA
jgi:hypothetical protein